MSKILWSPTPEQIREARLTHFADYVHEHFDAPATTDYSTLHRWSLADRGAFWSAVWSFTNVIGTQSDTAYVPGPHMTEAIWFPGSSLNFAENLLRPDEAAEAVAILAANESGTQRTITRGELLRQSTAFAEFLRSQGVGPGDRVAAVLPNVPEAVIAMLGTAALGAVWSSCSPDFGDAAIVDRFAQIAPTVLVICEEAIYAGKRIPVRERIETVLPQIPGVKVVVVVGAPQGELPGVETIAFEDAILAPAEAFHFERFSFAQPLFIVFSSGTTGKPKCIVHGAGGTLLQHLKEHQLHSDIRPGDRLFFHTTTGWMMWNWLVSALASRATILLYDGSPLHPQLDQLFDLAARTKVTHFGSSARYYAHLEKSGVRPREQHDLSAVRMILSTGSPLLPDGFDYIYRDVKADIGLASISGGTEIISCFALGCPTRPVVRGELQVKGLGMDVHVFDSNGQTVVGEPGELVCTSPFPSMPICFWNDPGKAKYLAAYFAVYDNVWRHGDWATETSSSGLVIEGRSDTTLNPGGVRIGTAELYSQVEAFEEVAEAIAAPLRRDGDERIVLFVRMRSGKVFSQDLVDAIKLRLRTKCSPRHVPAIIAEVPDFPRTVSGKTSEVAVRDAINGRLSNNIAALANPESLAFFQKWQANIG